MKSILPPSLPPSLPASLPQLDIMEAKVPEDIYKTHLEHVSKWNSYSSFCTAYHSPSPPSLPPSQGSAQ